VRLNRNLFCANSLSDIIRMTAVVTATGFLSMTTAHAESERPTPANQPKQDAPAAAPTPPPAVAPAPAPAPAAPQSTEPPARDAKPAQPDPRTVSTSGPAEPPQTPPSQLRGMREGRRTVDDNMVSLSLKDEGIESIIPYIFEWTGKHVFYKKSELGAIKLTIVGTREMPKSQALDYLFQALKMNGIAATETADMIYLGSLNEFNKTQPGVVLGPEEDVMAMPDNGLFVTKLFRLKQSRAADVLQRIQGLIPEDYARAEADGDSNQIILSGDIGLAKKVQTLINMLDVPSWTDFATETFRLQYQDANTIAGLINELFADSGAGGSSSTRNANRAQRGQPNQPVPGAAHFPDVVEGGLDTGHQRQHRHQQRCATEPLQRACLPRKSHQMLLHHLAHARHKATENECLKRRLPDLKRGKQGERGKPHHQQRYQRQHRGIGQRRGELRALAGDRAAHQLTQQPHALRDDSGARRGNCPATVGHPAPPLHCISIDAHQPKDFTLKIPLPAPDGARYP